MHFICLALLQILWGMKKYDMRHLQTAYNIMGTTVKIIEIILNA